MSNEKVLKELNQKAIEQRKEEKRARVSFLRNLIKMWKFNPLSFKEHYLLYSKIHFEILVYFMMENNYLLFESYLCFVKKCYAEHFKKDLPESVSHWGRRLLEEAVFRNKIKFVELLIKNGANVNSVSLCSFTLLSSLAFKGRFDMVEFLIEAGADVNPKEKDVRTPLYAAATQGHFNVVKLLLEKGADPNAKDHHEISTIRMTLFMAAKMAHYEDVEAKNRFIDICKLLLFKGAKIDNKVKGYRLIKSFIQELENINKMEDPSEVKNKLKADLIAKHESIPPLGEICINLIIKNKFDYTFLPPPIRKEIQNRELPSLSLLDKVGKSFGIMPTYS